MGMLAKIRRMHLRDGLSIREVSRRTGWSRNTVRQWLRQEGVTEPKYPKRETASAVNAWAEHLASALKADQHRPVPDLFGVRPGAVSVQPSSGLVCTLVSLRQGAGAPVALDAGDRSSGAQAALARGAQCR